MNRVLLKLFLGLLGVPSMTKDAAGNVTLVDGAGAKTAVGGGAPVVLTAGRALTAADNGATFMRNGGAITMTVPAGLPAGFGCKFIQGGAGAITVSGDVATVASVSSYVKTSGANSQIELVQKAADAYILTGQGAVA